MTGQKTLLERPADQLKLGLLLDRAKTKPRDLASYSLSSTSCLSCRKGSYDLAKMCLTF